MALVAYELAWWLVRPLVWLYLKYRARDNAAYRLFHNERWGKSFPTRQEANRPLLWLHAVSLGETRAAAPLIARLLAHYPDCDLLLTHMTPTGRAAGLELVLQFGRNRIFQSYLPYDTKSAQRNFFRHWKPRLGIIMETEVWPRLCFEAHESGTPLVLVNARLSEKSLRKAERWPALIRPAIQSFRKVLAQTENDQSRIAQLGVEQISLMGNLKYEILPNQAQIDVGLAWRKTLDDSEHGKRLVVLFAVSREGEEKLFLDCWRTANREQFLLIIVPRHPERFDDVAVLAAERGLTVVRRSQITDATQIGAATMILGDTMGEMPFYYALSDVAVLGGSLLKLGGQNLIESLACSCPIIAGPHTFNFAQAALDAQQAGALLKVNGFEQAVNSALTLAEDPTARSSMVRAGLAMIQQHQGATERVLQSVALILGPSPLR